MFQQAHGGTLFIDEIGELPTTVQATLLRTLETGEVKPVGADHPVQVDVRVVAATNRDLKAEVERGNFRSDLFYRLEVVRLRLPPLRERPEDIAGIIDRLLNGRVDHSQPIAGPNLQRCIAHGWPGNVRELRNVLDRAVALASRIPGRLPAFGDLNLNTGAPSERPVGLSYPGLNPLLPFKQAKQRLLEDFERAYIKHLMTLHQGQVSAVADAAGLSRKHVYELLKRSGLSPDES
jgi:DNA-binding NtrC family response regulator